MRALVAVVICLTVALPSGAVGSSPPQPLLQTAARLSGLRVRRPVATVTVSASRYRALLARAAARELSPAKRQDEAALYAGLGLTQRTAAPAASRAWYDSVTRRLVLQRHPRASRGHVVNELVRALVDQDYGLHRLAGLRARDRDRWLAARGVVEGTAALASGLTAGAVRGTALDRFVQLQDDVGRGPGRALVAQLRYLGGRGAVATALRTFPQTTEQLLHVDKFLERERALAVRLPAAAGGESLGASQTFGELDVSDLLRAFGVSRAGDVAAGWGGGRLAHYGSVTALVLRWDSFEDALEWQAAVPEYVTKAFAGETARACPPLDDCWSGPTDLAAGSYGSTSVFAAGPGAATVAAELLADQQ